MNKFISTNLYGLDMTRKQSSMIFQFIWTIYSIYKFTRAVIDTDRIDESTKKHYRLSISKKAQHIDSYAN